MGIRFETIEFFYIKFNFNASYALVPRFETETLVREAIAEIKNNMIETLIDMGTGTGIIPISIEKNTSTLKEIYGLDISKRALKIAFSNKIRTTSDIRLEQSNLLGVFINGNIKLEEMKTPILVTANLPYIKTDDWENMGEDLVEEPRMALFGGKGTGFELYERFFRQVLRFKRLVGDRKIILMCEFGYDQSRFANDFFVSRGLMAKLFADPRGIMRFIRVEI